MKLPNFLSFFKSKFSTWLKCEMYAIPLALLVYVSPLPPLSTVNFVRERLRLSFLDDKANFSGRFRELFEVIKHTHIYGSRKPMEQYVDRVLGELEGELDVADYNLSNVYSMVSLFTTLLPTLIVSTLVFIDASSAVNSALMLSFIAVIVSFIGLTVYPSEVSFSPPPIRIYLFFLLTPLLYFIMPTETRLLASVSIASIPSCILTFMHLKHQINELKDELRIVRTFISSPLNPFSSMKIKPSNLLKKGCLPIVKAVNTGFYLIALHSEDKQSYSLLNTYFLRYYKFIMNLRRKTRIMLFYSILESAMSTGIYVFLIVTLAYLSSQAQVMPSGIGLYIPSTQEIDYFYANIDLIITLNATALSVLTATIREGNPAYFSLYLFPISLTTLVTYHVTNLLAPSILGVTL